MGIDKYCEICGTLITVKSNRKQHCDRCSESAKKVLNGGVVYLITNNINNKKYVGITTSINGFKGRYRSGSGNGIERVYTHLKYHKEYGSYYNIYLFRAIEKYGFENFTVLEEFEKVSSKKELMQREMHWIKYFKSNDMEFGYNLTSGGEGVLSWSDNRDTLLKYRKSKASTLNERLIAAFNKRREWAEKFLGIWDMNDGLDTERKLILFHMLLGGEIKGCGCCGVKIKKHDQDFCSICKDSKFVLKNKPRKNNNKKTKKKSSSSQRISLEMEQNKELIIDMYVNRNMSVSEIAISVGIKGLQGFLVKNFLLGNNIKIKKSKLTGYVPICHNAITDIEGNILEVFEYKYESKDWINDNGISSVKNGFSNGRLNTLLKNGEDYNGYKFKLINENEYKEFEFLKGGVE